MLYLYMPEIGYYVLYSNKSLHFYFYFHIEIIPVEMLLNIYIIIKCRNIPGKVLDLWPMPG